MIARNIIAQGKKMKWVIKNMRILKNDKAAGVAAVTTKMY